MTGNAVAVLMLLLLSPWIATTLWIAGGDLRDYVWFNFGIDLLRRRS
jgi:hypothetical protein